MAQKVKLFYIFSLVKNIPNTCKNFYTVILKIFFFVRSKRLLEKFELFK